MDFDLINREQIYDGRVIKVVKDTIQYPDGRDAERELVIHGGASAIVPFDEEGNIIFVRQFRHSARKFMLEIPAGMLDDGEDPLACAIRELEEETGFKAGRFTFMLSMYSSIGFSNEVLNIYMAESLIEGEQNLDDEEIISLEKYPIEEAIEQIFSGAIRDSKTIAGIFAAKQLLERRKNS